MVWSIEQVCVDIVAFPFGTMDSIVRNFETIEGYGWGRNGLVHRTRLCVDIVAFPFGTMDSIVRNFETIEGY